MPSEGVLVEWLDCPECGADVLPSRSGAWTDGTEDVCRECGTVVYVSLDDSEDPPRATVDGEAVVDIGQARCDGTECGHVAEHQGGPCFWNCARARP